MNHRHFLFLRRGGRRITFDEEFHIHSLSGIFRFRIRNSILRKALRSLFLFEEGLGFKPFLKGNDHGT
jgi:hypothetical protein